MNELPPPDAGIQLASRVATVIATLAGLTIVAAGGTLYSHSAAIAEFRVKCEQARTELFELHDHLAQYPSASDLTNCRSRVEAVERYLELDKHRMGKIEKMLDDLARVPTARPDPFTGTEGRDLERRIKSLETRP